MIMRRTFYQAFAIAVFVLVTAAMAFASSIDNYIQDLKSENADVRAKAAYELGCG
jgi:hypothetical protein